MAGQSSTTRSRFREQMHAEIKTAALIQLADGGVEKLSLKSIARDLGLTGPGLYRYVESREVLLGWLFVDAYIDLTSTLEDEARSHSDAFERIRAMSAKYCAWAIAQPHRYRLIFKEPVPDVERNAEYVWNVRQRLNAAFIRALNCVPTLVAQPGAVEHPSYSEWASTYFDTPIDPAVLRASLSLMIRLHGFVSLEIEGSLNPTWLDGGRILKHEVDGVLNQ